MGIINQKDLFPQILQEYVNLVEDVDTKLNLATKFKCHDVVIDVSLKKWEPWIWSSVKIGEL